MSASLQKVDEGQWRLTGTLDFESAVDLRPRLREALRAGAAVTIDLSGVTRANSAALALLLQWHEDARRRGAQLSVRQPPPALVDLAGLSNLTELLVPADQAPA